MKLLIISDYKTEFTDLSGSSLTDALILKCAAKEGADPGKLPRIKRSEKGKPYFTEGPCFSVSHSGNIFGCIFSEHNVGLDIQHRRNVNAVRMAERFFTEEEADLVRESVSGEERSSDEFFRLWARKEAYAKYTGEGLAQVMNRTDVIGRKDVQFTDMRICEDCFCAVCTGVGEGENADEIQISY